MKNLLKKLYHDNHGAFSKVRNTFADRQMGGPFMISPGDIYSKQPFPLLIIGQETFGWSSLDTVGEQMRNYQEFNVGKDYYASPFWNITRKLEVVLGNEPYSCAWTNLNRFDLDGRRPYGEYEEKIATLDAILASEIRILEPKVCLFFTGPYFDDRINRLFDAIEYRPLDAGNFSNLYQLIHPDLPKLTFRSYHPHYLRRKKLETDFISFVASRAKSVC